MKKSSIRAYLAGVATTLLVGALVFPAGAALVQKAITVYSGVNVYVNNEKVELKDGNGQPLEAFNYKGNVYLAAQTVGKISNATTHWDGNTKSVYFGKKPSQVTYLMDVCPPYEASGNFYQASEKDQFEMAGKQYSNGLFSTTNERKALFHLNGQYDTLSLICGHRDGYSDEAHTVTFSVDGKVVKTVELEKDCLPKEVTVPLNGGLQLKIQASDHVGLANMTVK